MREDRVSRGCSIKSAHFRPGMRLGPSQAAPFYLWPSASFSIADLASSLRLAAEARPLSTSVNSPASSHPSIQEATHSFFLGFRPRPLRPCLSVPTRQ